MEIIKVSAILSFLLQLLSVNFLRAEAQLPDGLSYDYYKKTCPQVENIVRDQMNSFSSADNTIPAAVLRLIFHDCQVGGCDGSVLLDIKDETHNAEMDSVKNFGVRKRELLDQIKSKVEEVCPQQVSCADILLLAARDSVAIAGGPQITVPLGRKDTNTPHTRQEADKGLPRNNVDVTVARKVFFDEVGINLEEMVAFLGAHTLGETHCDGIMDRLYVNETDLPPGNEAEYVKYLKKTCPKNGKGQFTTTLDLDPTPQVFDNAYFVNALQGKGIILLDAEMARDSRTVDIVRKFANDQDAFFKVFSSAFAKFSTLGVLTGDKGVIRKKCSALNS